MFKRILWAGLVAVMMAGGGLVARRLRATIWRWAIARRLLVRLATWSYDTPAAGEAVARVSSILGSFTTERYPGQGRMAPALVVDRDSELVGLTEPRITDLSVGRVRMIMTVTAADGRQLVARFGSDVDAPQIDADAPPDLRDAIVRAWRKKPPLGPPSGQDARIQAIIEAARDLGEGAAKRDRVAAQLGRVDPWDQKPNSDFKRDVRAAGGWREVRRLAFEK